MFTNKELRNLIIPLFIEQFLLMFVGIADTFVVSFSGEADVSGVSLVTSFNTVLIFLFTALSSGGAVIISQYIGSQNPKAASRSAGQLLMISTVLSTAMAVPILLFRTQLLRLLFGKIEADVMSACESYLWIAMAPVYTTVIGQCMGARDIDAANFYFRKLNKITLILSVLWNALIFAITPVIVRYCAISPEAKALVIWLVLINNIFNGLAYPFAGSLGNGLRAAGDVKFTMVVSITLTIAARLFFSALFGIWMGWGVIGVAIGMSIDLVFRGGIFIWRLKSQKWTQFQLI